MLYFYKFMVAVIRFELVLALSAGSNMNQAHALRRDLTRWERMLHSEILSRYIRAIRPE